MEINIVMEMLDQVSIEFLETKRCIEEQLE